MINKYNRMSSIDRHPSRDSTPEDVRKIVDDIDHALDGIRCMNWKQQMTQKKAKILGKKIYGLTDEVNRFVLLYYNGDDFS
jgi:hypothetical protein